MLKLKSCCPRWRLCIAGSTFVYCWPAVALLGGAATFLRWPEQCVSTTKRCPTTITTTTNTTITTTTTTTATKTSATTITTAVVAEKLKLHLFNHIAISNSYSIVLLFSVVYRRVQNIKIAYCAPTLRSNATTSGLFSKMAKLRGVLPCAFAFTSALPAISSSHTAV
jgi:hypothetical protein